MITEIKNADGKNKTVRTLLVLIAFAFPLFSLLNLSGCASSTPPPTAKTEAEIYQEAMQQSNTESLRAIRTETILQPLSVPLSETSEDPNNDTAFQAQKRLAEQFPQLPNPETIVYVYPHLGSDGVPVPGYYTSFHLYTENHYALPGEMEIKR